MEADAAIYDIETVLKLVCDGITRMRIDHGPPVKFWASMRLRLFAAKGVTCVTCGCTGAFFALEHRTLETPHMNLYSAEGILMTMDHIRPRSKGGPHHLSNLQPMCEPCNAAKADTWEPQPVRYS